MNTRNHMHTCKDGFNVLDGRCKNIFRSCKHRHSTYPNTTTAIISDINIIPDPSGLVTATLFHTTQKSNCCGELTWMFKLRSQMKLEACTFEISNDSRAIGLSRHWQRQRRHTCITTTWHTSSENSPLPCSYPVQFLWQRLHYSLMNAQWQSAVYLWPQPSYQRSLHVAV